MHMTLPHSQRKPGHDRLQQHRFLASYATHFTQWANGKSWPRRANTRRAAGAYMRGLLGPGSGKNMQGIAKRVRLDEDRIERFVRESPWSHDSVQEHLVQNVPKRIASPEGAFILDDVGLVKKGRMSVAAYRQWCGATGKVDECQVAVDLTYAVPSRERNADQRTWPLGMELYVPMGWLTEPEYALARDEAKLPVGIAFRTKHGIALDLIDRARAIPHACTIADAGYGDNGEFRRNLRTRDEAYVLGVSPSNVRVIDALTPVMPPRTHGRPGRPETHATHARGVKREAPRTMARRVQEWTRVDWGAGTKGVLGGDFWRSRVRVVEGPKNRRWVTDEVAWLLLERRSNELKAYLCWGFDDASLEELVAVAHLRWTIEQFHREAKQMLGLDQFQGRTWKGWHHHVTMVLLAYAYLALERARGTAADRLPTLPQTANALMLEVATQTLLKKHRLKRRQAKGIARTMLLELTTWKD